MKSIKYQIEWLPEEAVCGNTEAYERVCLYLLQRYYEGCEEYESISVFEGVNGGTGGKGLFITGSED